MDYIRTHLRFTRFSIRHLSGGRIGRLAHGNDHGIVRGTSVVLVDFCAALHCTVTLLLSLSLAVVRRYAAALLFHVAVLRNLAVDLRCHPLRKGDLLSREILHDELRGVERHGEGHNAAQTVRGAWALSHRIIGGHSLGRTRMALAVLAA